MLVEVPLIDGIMMIVKDVMRMVIYERHRRLLVLLLVAALS